MTSVTARPKQQSGAWTFRTLFIHPVDPSGILSSAASSMVIVITDLVMPMFWMPPRTMDTHTTAMVPVAVGRTTVTTAIGATATGATGAEVTHPMAIAMVWAREVQEDIGDIT